ncbi:hypothetical protein QQ045_003582 [Rhodiola kirilowii]
MANMNADSDDMYMSTLATLDNPIIDEYDRDEMEELDNVADENPDAKKVQDRIVWNHSGFSDISVWEIYRPFDENVRVYHPHSPDLQKGTTFGGKRMSYLQCRNTQFLIGLSIGYWKAWKAQQKALVYLFGKWEESFNRLPHLMQALQDSSNNNNFVKWDVTPLENGTVHVNRIFWSFAECILAFNHCHPLISVNGTHIYGKYNAKLLVAIGLDANNHILPLAFALVESENNSSWKWFMSCIREGVTQREGLCVVSDRHNGILAAMR